jgi:TetR/AcrR family transcriptional regulator, transcriptional repressor for nem operon
MRQTRDDTERNRREVLDAAERLFRERGFDGVGVADLMKAAGFTHGGFYNHFASKDQLEQEASAAALARSNAALAESLGKARPDGWKPYIRQYLSAGHRDDPARGCTLSALAPDAARKGPGVQARFAEAIETVVGILTAYLARKRGRGQRAAGTRARAVQMLSEMVGALVLSRAVAAANPALSKEILAANLRKLGG